jgi:hypothetical protein
MRSLSDAYFAAQQNPSAAALTQLKDTYLNVFPGLASDDKRRLQAADNIRDVGSLFYTALDRGMRVRLKVKTLFKHEEDDDDDSAKKAKPADHEKEARISPMSGPRSTTVVTTFKSARPTWSMRITTNSALTTSPAVAPGPAA